MHPCDPSGYPTNVITQLYIASLGSINTENMVMLSHSPFPQYSCQKDATNRQSKYSYFINKLTNIAGNIAEIRLHFTLQDYSTDTYLRQKWTDPRLASDELKVGDC
jgi:hypothetical protein